MDGDRVLRVAHKVAGTTAEGPGARFAIWVQGCSIRCAGCCNPEMFPREAGSAIAVAQLAADIAATDVEGITLLGGEPFEQPGACAELARRVRHAGRSVMVFTGYEREQLEARADPEVAALLGATDLLVDGPFERSRPERARRWIGSSNQRTHFLTSRYGPDDARLRAPNQLVIQLGRGVVEVHGWPGARLFARER